jgi:hypothetical protein
MLNAGMGCIVTPALRFLLFSGVSGLAPRSCAGALDTGKVRISNGMPLMKFVDVAVKKLCCSDGARKPVE